MDPAAYFGTPHSVHLPDGTSVIVRTVRPEDAGRLQAAVGTLSETSRYLRFFTALTRLRDDQLHYLTHVDGDDHVAIGAVDPAQSSMPGVGVARYIRLPEEPHVAEAAATVVDPFQRRGLGSWLFAALSLWAEARGVTRFRAFVLAENPLLQALLAAGAEQRRLEGGVHQLDLPVLTDPEALPSEVVLETYREALCDLRRVVTV